MSSKTDVKSSPAKEEKWYALFSGRSYYQRHITILQTCKTKEEATIFLTDLFEGKLPSDLSLEKDTDTKVFLFMLDKRTTGYKFDASSETFEKMGMSFNLCDNYVNGRFLVMPFSGTRGELWKFIHAR